MTMRPINLLVFVTVAVFPRLQEGNALLPTCRPTDQNSFEGPCPVKLSPKPEPRQDGYAECISVHVLIKAHDLENSPRIVIKQIERQIVEKTTVITPRKETENNKTLASRRKVICAGDDIQQWELIYNCVEAKYSVSVSVIYNATSINCSDKHTVQDAVPEFYLSPNPSFKSITVTVKSEEQVLTTLCYKKNQQCSALPITSQVTITPSQSTSAVLNIPYMLPCLCVQVYYTHADAMRISQCPFENDTLIDVKDVWNSYKVTSYESYLEWKFLCSASVLKISASLCWKKDENVCTRVLNHTLEATKGGQNLIYNTSAVDRHPKMCVMLSLQDSHNISCPFNADTPSWDVNIGHDKQSVFVYVTSDVSAMFSAQFCVIEEMGCSPIGPVHTVKTGAKTAETRLHVPPHFLTQRPCVQVWQSDPALLGRRILCPDYTRYRHAIYVVTPLILVVIILLLGVFIYRLHKGEATGWLYIPNPVLLVCSSEQSAYVSAVCALASILQGELSATVNMALWSQSSEARTGVADLGPLPWLYGQWETVRKAQGKVLIIWSPEAKITYEKWKKERENMDKSQRKKEDDSKADVRQEKIRANVEEDHKLNRIRLTKCKKDKASGRQNCVQLYKDENPQMEPSSVTEPMFAAALACMHSMLQQCKGEGLVIVYFQGLGHSKDVPKALKGVPRYCLPQDFRGLIQELGGMKRETKSGKFMWPCWSRLLSKVHSAWLARQLACRLQTRLPQQQGKKSQGANITSSQKNISDTETESMIKFSLSANTTLPETVQEYKPLYASL